MIELFEIVPTIIIASLLHPTTAKLEHLRKKMKPVWEGQVSVVKTIIAGNILKPILSLFLQYVRIAK